MGVLASGSVTTALGPTPPPRAIAFVIAAGLAACAGRGPPPSTVAVLAPPASSAAPAVSGAIAVPGAQGCVLPTRQRHALRFQPDGEWFALTMGAPGTIDLGTAGPAAGALVRVARGGVSVAGLLPASEVQLYPTRALVLGGFVVPQSITALAWKATSLGEITVSLAPEGIELVTAGSLDALRLPCNAVGVEASRFDPRSVVPRSTRERDFELARRGPVPLSRLPDEPPIARILPGEGPASVTVIEARGARSLIRMVRRDAVIFGWIPTSALGEEGAWFNEEFSHGDGFTLEPEPEPITGVVRCPRALPVVAVRGADKRVVGSIAPGTELSVHAASEGIVPFALPPGLVDLRPEVRLGVPAERLSGCGR